MIETLLALIGVTFTPQIAQMLSPVSSGLVGGLVMDKLIILALIIAITIVTNIIRALRYCRDNKGGFASTGIWYGFKKGLTCGLIALIAYIIIGFVPILATPFLVLSFIPGLGNLINGIILAFFYLLGYMFVAYPIWGVC